MQKLLIIIISIFSFQQTGFSQIDSTVVNLNEVVVTATRSERKLGNVAVPVSIISAKNIQQAASLRLNDILNEQAGLYITSGFGSGVQMQGLNPDYTLILINGEPLIGRTAGVLDLNRITVGNIQKIEIVKGPSSSLYGSEAMAGVINIITKQPIKNNYSFGLRYGTYNTIDANATAAVKLNKLMLQVFSNYYSTNGFSIRPNSVERTVAPIERFTNQVQINYPFSNKTKLSVLARYNYENIINKIAVGNTGSVTYSDGIEKHNDYNINPILTHQFSKNVNSSLRLYHSRFKSTQDLSTNTPNSYNDYFLQDFYRAENQTDINLGEKNSMNIGAGYIAENVRSSRYDSKDNVKHSNVSYGFIQNEFKPTEKLSIIGGLRYDKNSVYASAFSPKLAFHYKSNKYITLNASIGRGFKAPDFRQLYLNFTNTAAGSYSVFGALEAQTQVAYLDKQGQIQSFENDYYKLAALQPEFSTGINVGAKVIASKNTFIETNIFRNDIENLIDSRLIAYYKSGAQIFSYLNVKNAYTQGFEVNINHKLNNTITISSGYQYLETADKDQIDAIKKGLVFTKDGNGISRKMELSEYVGLPNRSNHMANFKILYEKNNFFINTRLMYRSRWAVGDKDGNGLYNTNDEFAKGFLQVNTSIGYQIKQTSLQLGSDNILNYSDNNNLPNLPGRTFYISLKYQITNKNK